MFFVNSLYRVVMARKYHCKTQMNWGKKTQHIHYLIWQQSRLLMSPLFGIVFIESVRAGIIWKPNDNDSTISIFYINKNSNWTFVTACLSFSDLISSCDSGFQSHTRIFPTEKLKNECTIYWDLVCELYCVSVDEFNWNLDFVPILFSFRQ